MEAVLTLRLVPAPQAGCSGDGRSGTGGPELTDDG
jgi:hypothetical protein